MSDDANIPPTPEEPAAAGPTESAGSDSASGGGAAEDAATGSIRDELNDLGRNLSAIFYAAWDSDERKKVQQEIQTGLNELANIFSKTADDLAKSGAAQQVRTGLDDIGERLKASEVQERVRVEIASALRTANESLKRTAASSPPAEPPPATEAPAPETEKPEES